MHRTNTSQNSWQLILSDVCDPLCDSILDYFVDTQETAKNPKSYRGQLNYLCDIITDNLICTNHFSDNQENGCSGLKMTNVTHVCSTASSASTLSSLTEPVRSEFLRMFPMKQGEGQVTTMQILHGYLSIIASLQVFEEVL